MNSVLFAGLFVFASAVLGDNKGEIACVISVVLDTGEVTFDTADTLELFFVCNVRSAQLNAADVS